LNHRAITIGHQYSSIHGRFLVWLFRNKIIFFKLYLSHHFAWLLNVWTECRHACANCSHLRNIAREASV
jgi:hypothetical protein